MARDPRHDVLFEPLQIGPKTLRNRFYQVPHCTGFGTEKPRSQAAHRAMKAEGGWAAVCTEYCAVSPDSDEIPFISARLWDDGDLRNLALVCEQAHEHGALAGCELHRSGVHCPRREYRLPAIAPSQLMSDYLLVVPKAMEKEDIRRVQADWVAAARRARDAGFDIVYVYGAHSYLPMQFLSPFYNKRTDEYGGPLEDRARFWLELLELVREVVGEECAIASRIAVDALGPHGVEIDEALASFALWGRPRRSLGRGRRLGARVVEGLGRLPLLQRGPAARVNRPGARGDREADRRRRPAHEPGPNGGDRPVRRWDVIGAARPSIADPFLPRKVEEDRSDEIRECTGCNVCISKADPGRNVGCTQNATAGEEYRRGWHPERFERARNTDCDVLVVGAGPSGMEVRDRPRQARVPARPSRRRRARDRRDHALGPAPPGARRVGSRPQLAGDPALEAQKRGRHHGGAAGRPERARVRRRDRRRRDGRALGRERRQPRHTRADPWRRRRPPPSPHARADHARGEEAPPASTCSSTTARATSRPPASRRSSRSTATGSGPATCFDGIAPFCHETLEDAFVRRRLHDLGVATHTGVTLRAIGEGRVLGEDEFGDSVDVPADAVVTQRLSNEELYLELKSDPDTLRAQGVEALYRIGDCVAPQLIADAIFDGHRLAREIDSHDPARPLPWKRERPLLESAGYL